jgi:outer membrane protein assembly factor BamA
MAKDVDLVDVGRNIFNHKPPRTDSNSVKDKQETHITVLPAFGYTLQTGFAAVLSANATFQTYKDTATQTSVALASVTYSQYKQVILPVQTYIWTKDNKYNINTDWRFMKYPQYTYGLGGNTDRDNGYRIDYANIHLYQTVLRKISPAIYAGLGYNFDYYWDVQELDPPATTTDFQGYGITKTVKASGVTLNALYDNRLNPVNPQQGSFAKITYRANATFLGSDADWSSVAVDLRHYIKLPGGSRNVLAIWSYDWFTTGGTPPYLMLPSTGWDPNSNTGRGYIQGRYRGDNMLYLEAEYRFAITNNGLLGAVAYGNAQSISEPVTNKFNYIAPGAGVGLRLKLNKFSNTNIAVDYGIGTQGSRGFWVNLGEVF